ncbi:hypothetical protein V4V35_23900 [Bacillus infantis]|uniref:hypothetical protein n=1 Tax=Bacillus infantis TaxID=324767 RepID=UPI002FBDFFBD
MLGISLLLDVKEKNLITQSIETHLPKLKKSEKPLFQLTLKKAKEDKPVLDGMYMRCMEQSLAAKGDPECVQLAAKIEKSRLQFQLSAMNRPQVTA